MIDLAGTLAALRGAGGKVPVDQNEYLHFYEKMHLILLLLGAAVVKCLKDSCDKKRQNSRIVGGRSKSFSVNGIPGFSRQEAPVKRTIRKFMKNM
ncbi:hypothetical protein [Heyndrickxia coagulans]|uniref:hypothetical protein n=1 Tax=Heyndrickxia coagulans TaxID=1398 RepID=UPI0015C5DA37|nr:hypothetical protein [Heyndrickxia coagulans]